jgi:hypothetical protein
MGLGSEIREPGKTYPYPRSRGQRQRILDRNNVRKSKPFLEIFCPVLETSAAALSMVVATNKTLALRSYPVVKNRAKDKLLDQPDEIRQEKRLTFLQMFIKRISSQ